MITRRERFDQAMSAYADDDLRESLRLLDALASDDNADEQIHNAQAVVLRRLGETGRQREHLEWLARHGVTFRQAALNELRSLGYEAPPAEPVAPPARSEASSAQSKPPLPADAVAQEPSEHDSPGGSDATPDPIPTPRPRRGRADVTGTVRDVGQRVQFRWSRTIWTFRLERGKDDDNPLIVEIRADTIRGELKNGDKVRVRGRWREGVVRTLTVDNLRTGSKVRGRNQVLWMIGGREAVGAVFTIAFVIFALTWGRSFAERTIDDFKRSGEQAGRDVGKASAFPPTGGPQGPDTLPPIEDVNDVTEPDEDPTRPPQEPDEPDVPAWCEGSPYDDDVSNCFVWAASDIVSKQLSWELGVGDVAAACGAPAEGTDGRIPCELTLVSENYPAGTIVVGIADDKTVSYDFDAASKLFPTAPEEADPTATATP